MRRREDQLAPAWSLQHEETGKNLTLTPLSIIIGWLTELFRFNSATGHYTQLVWAATEKLGCGMVYYQVRQILININQGKINFRETPFLNR